MFKAPHAPTVIEGDAMEVPTKYNFTETIYRPVWQVRMDKPAFFSLGIRGGNRYGTDALENVERKMDMLTFHLLKSLFKYCINAGGFYE